MIRYPLIFILALAIAFAQKQAPEKSKTEAKAQPKTEAVAIPSGAVETAPGVYKHTDSSGKNWIYRKTPFGIAKMAEMPEADSKASETMKSGNPFGSTKDSSANSTSASVTAVEEDDIIRFERSTPFGPSRWTRKKSELTADEQEILERSRTRKGEKTGTKE